ncbi:uncharacterized mitochondrial protein AtMg00310-like [Vicia villosa]|uniref:uncharacterized mitochondrial protein AtMg00310-like n=1 Tax=Vicia villosa TaxID=3911 RepID=UPI00273BC564|nr:uncharacterized mitochondrial protein AtMg00310-like [Vicia villosa]
MVGANLRRKHTWLRVLNNLRSRLSMWKGRNISIGGRVTLINSVLNAIPSFTLSFFKAPGLVLKEIRSILNNFLWCGNANKRCGHWVDWHTVCKPKEKGGLGVRDVGEVNKALLLKWKWRILLEDKTLCSDFLAMRYFDPKVKVLAIGGCANSSKDSLWWRDVINIDLMEAPCEDGFKGCVQSIFKKEPMFLSGLVFG